MIAEQSQVVYADLSLVTWGVAMASVEPQDAVGPLTIIHREFRSAELNKKYYGYKLDRYQLANRWIEIIIAVGATTGTGIAGFAIWKNGAGTTAWGIISGLSIVLATLKPIIALPKQIERYSKLSSAYSKIFETYRLMEQDFESTGLTTEHLEQFKQLRIQVAELVADDDRHPNMARETRPFLIQPQLYALRTYGRGKLCNKACRYGRNDQHAQHQKAPPFPRGRRVHIQAHP